MLHAMAIMVTLAQPKHAQRRADANSVHNSHAVGSLDLHIFICDLKKVQNGVCAKVLTASKLVVDARENVQLDASDVSVYWVVTCTSQRRHLTMCRAMMRCRDEIASPLVRPNELVVLSLSSIVARVVSQFYVRNAVSSILSEM